VLSDTSVWKLPPPDLRLEKNDVHLWRASLDHHALDIPQFEQSLLSRDERLRASRLRFTRDRRRFIAGRGILRLILGSYAGCAPADLVFSYGHGGKPSVDMPAGGDLLFNVSHSEALALYAISAAGEVGVDVERVREIPEWAHIAALCFTKEENVLLASASPSERCKLFFQAWTRKEAVAKAAGTGLTDVGDVPPGAGTPLTSKQPGPARKSRSPVDDYWLQPLLPADGFVGTIAVDGPVRELVCLTWGQRESLASRPVEPVFSRNNGTLPASASPSRDTLSSRASASAAGGGR
jgi:4'-phosphopantetheinyl transferase